MPAEVSIHDNLVLSYTVDCRDKKIIFRIAFYDAEPHEYTDIIFSEVVAYHFEGDNCQTILFDILQASPEEIYLSHREVFERKKNYAWPFDYNTEQELLKKLNDKSIKGFLISSSYGMDGFVLAENMQMTLTVKQPSK